MGCQFVPRFPNRLFPAHRGLAGKVLADEDCRRLNRIWFAGKDVFQVL